MAPSTIDLSRDRYTYADLEALPPDERSHYELSHGVLVVTPSPSSQHQLIMGLIVGFLLSHKFPGQRVLPETELLIRTDLVKRPDVQVVDQSLVGGQCVVGVPALVVEIHSPSTKLLDLTEKRTVYEEAKIPAYWLVDPDSLTLSILELNQEGHYEELAAAGPESLIKVSRPFPSTLDPRQVLAGGSRG